MRSMITQKLSHQSEGNSFREYRTIVGTSKATIVSRKL